MKNLTFINSHLSISFHFHNDKFVNNLLNEKCEMKNVSRRRT